ncbi:DUF1419 domain-containing protein [Ruegeria sp. YS9]|uniref:DUF1419 domain-containing protein n=1 Tax=Ruegeria sp. YS9 TaxID=2966453 RepID=UPI00214C1D89|nr:DUF1419 domain-containing protein [Ruegeria sp. YS9]UUV08727.1 DUF1419 domain-containing protein [Ruegeria sp. YS9]
MTDFVKISEGVSGESETFKLLNRGYTPDVRKAGQWFEVEPQMWDYFLNVLPPKHWLGGAFVMSEAATEFLSDAWIKIGDRAFCLAVQNTGQGPFSETVSAFHAHVAQQVAA